MKTIYRYALIFFLVYAQDVFSDLTYNPHHNTIDVKPFPNSDIKYFSNNNKAESWRLVYGKLGRPPYNPNKKSHCNANESAPDEVLSFNISEIIKNAGDTFNADNIHVYYDGDTGEKALALLIGGAKIKHSFFAIADVLINKEDSKFAILTPAERLQSLKLLKDNEKNMMYICVGYSQQIVMQIHGSGEDINTNPNIDPTKIVFWYDGFKASSK